MWNACDSHHARRTALVAALVAVLLVPGTGASGDELTPVGSREAAEQREESDPTLVPLPEPGPRSEVPQDRYVMAGGCYTLQAPDGSWIATSAGGYATTTTEADAAPFHFQATELGRYLLFDADEHFVARGAGVTAAEAPSPAAEWTVDLGPDGFVLGDGAESLAVEGGSPAVGTATPFALRLADGCAPWDEIEVNVEGPVLAGTSPLQEVRGYLDDHIHHMTTGFLGGAIHCGRPWHPYGVKYALQDCPDHSATLGNLAIPEIVLSGNPTHDHVGWPTFKDWPAHDSLTHEGTYYKWVERAWRGGQRLWVNLLVENNVLCSVYPGPNKTCNDLDSIRTQAAETRAFENYVDAQAGGPGKGWYRVVTTPTEARAVINQGKLAVVLGTESSKLFGCSAVLDSPASECTEEAINAGLDELYALGVRQMVPTHKFDNAFSGVKGDEGFNGVVTNLGNVLASGTFLDMDICPEGLGPDNAQLNPSLIPQPDVARLLGGLFGTIASLDLLPVAVPLYSEDPNQCNSRGLTETGRYMLEQMVARNIVYDVDHMSARGRSEALTEFERLGYSGVISSHSWSDPYAIPRIFALGGMVNSYAGESTEFVEEWHGHVEDMDGRFYFGLGYGADTNGLGPQGGPRGADVENPVTYPFQGTFDVEIDHQESGERTYDINVDGVAHYGLYPDWIEDLKQIAGNTIDDDLVRGPEAYLQMWERANGITNDACRQPELRRQASDFTTIAAGTSSDDVLTGFGQPHLRRDSTYQYCALDGAAEATVTVSFAGTAVASVSTGDVPSGTGGGGATTGGGTPLVGPDGQTLAGGGTVNTSGARIPDTGGPSLGTLMAGLLAALIGGAMVASTRRLRATPRAGDVG
ncbi:hypothetical protein [Aeromicrobium sp. Leaf350]|uniref:hypothetical protein n=1 Tax=Aeromicrobium sp. Leaf350 TaxID=2876565 RepID=UPI001E34FBEE|nr:hypothetical protein [Aeromicrobium sp. Leaf350]